VIWCGARFARHWQWSTKMLSPNGMVGGGLLGQAGEAGWALWHGGMWGGNANQISIRREMLEMPWKQVDRRPAMPPTKRPVYRPSLEVRERAVGGASAEGRGTAACVSCIVSSASIRLRCTRRLRAVGAARSEICSRRLSYVSCQTSKDDCARRCDRRVLRIFAPFHAGQRGRRSDVSRSTFRSRDRNRQSLRRIVPVLRWKSSELLYFRRCLDA